MYSSTMLMDVDRAPPHPTGQDLAILGSATKPVVDSRLKTKMTRKRRAVEAATAVVPDEGQNDESEPETGQPPLFAASSLASASVVVARLETSRKTSDSDAVEALMSLHHRQPSSISPPQVLQTAESAIVIRRPAHKKLKRSASSLSSFKRDSRAVITAATASSSNVDTDSETDVTSHSPAQAPAGESHKREQERREVVVIDDEPTLRSSEVERQHGEEREDKNEDQEEVERGTVMMTTVKEEPRLPRAVRITSRAHLVLHQLYLRKRFNPAQRLDGNDNDDGSGVTSSSSTIGATSVPLYSLAANVASVPVLPPPVRSTLTSAASAAPLPRSRRTASPAGSPRSSAHPRSPASASPTSPPTSTSTSMTSSPPPTVAPQWPPQAIGGSIPCLTLPPSVSLPWSLLPVTASTSTSATTTLTPIRPRPRLILPTATTRARAL